MNRYPLDEDQLLRRRQLRRWTLWGVLALGLGLGTWFGFRPAGAAVKGWQARRHAAAAMTLIGQEKWTEARTEAVEAYQLRFTEPAAVRAVARLLSRTGQGHEALEFWRQLRDLGPDQPPEREDRRDQAAALLSVGELATAAETLHPSLEPEEQATPAELLLGAQIAARAGRPGDAARLAGRILAVKGPGAGVTPREALSAAAVVLSTGPTAETAGPAWSRIGELARGTDAPSLEALTLLARQALSPTPPPAVAAEVVPSPAEAARRLEEHPLAKTPHRLLAADLRIRAGPEHTAAEIDAAATRFGGPLVDAETLATLGTWLSSKGMFERVLAVIPTERALGSRELFLGHVDALAGLGRWAEIKRLLEADRFPLDPTVRYMYLARCGAQLGETATAIRNDWSAALAAAGKDVNKLLGVADYAEKNGALDTARDAFAAARDAVPRLRAAYLGEMRNTTAAPNGGGTTARIHAILAAMLLQWPDDPAIRNDEAYLRLLLNAPGTDARDVEQTAEALVGREPASLPHRTLLALARLRQDRPAAALEVFQDVRLPTGAAAPPSALAVHAAALAANGYPEPARQEARVAADSRQLRPEELALLEKVLKED